MDGGIAFPIGEVAASLAQNGGSSKATVTFAGQSEAGATILKVVDTQVGGAQIGALGDGVSTVLATANASGGWSVTSRSGFSYSSGNAYEVDVTARDVAGNISTISTFFRWAPWVSARYSEVVPPREWPISVAGVSFCSTR